MHPKTKWLRLLLPEAQKLASLASISSDLTDVLSYCAAMNALREAHKDITTRQALKEAAVVKYARCFASGVRQPIPHDLFDTAPANIKRWHEHFIDLRSKHVAHSVNEFEETDVFVLMEKVSHRYEIAEIGTTHARRASLGEKDVEALAYLVEWLQRWVEALSQTERASLLALAKQMGKKALREFGQVRTGSTALRAQNPKTRRAKP